MTDPGSSRRDFIKRSSKAGIAVLTAGGLGFWLRSRSEHPQQEVSASGVRDYRVDVSRPIPDMVVASDGSSRKLQRLRSMHSAEWRPLCLEVTSLS